MNENTKKELKTKVKTNSAERDQNDSSQPSPLSKPLSSVSSNDGINPNVLPPENRRYVKGIFKNIECPGTMLTFPFRMYKEPVKKYFLMDGGEYELPIEVVEHLNNNCAYKEHAWKLKGRDKMLKMDGTTHDDSKEVKQTTSRFMFQPLEYVAV